MLSDSKHYTNLAWVYDLFQQKNTDYLHLASLIDSNLKKHKAKKILHAGSGPGRLSKILSENYGYAPHLLDNSQPMIDLSQTLLPSLTHNLGDMSDFHSNEDFGAVVLASGTFPHLLEERETERSLENFNDALRPGGVLIFDNYYPDKMISGEVLNETSKVKNKGYDILRESKTGIVSYEPTIAHHKFTYRVIKDGGTDFFDGEELLRAFSKEEIKKFLEKVGFKFVEFFPSINEGSYFTIASAG